MEQLNTLWLSTGLYQLSAGQFVMILVGLVLLFLAIRKNFEPLLLIPIGFGGILANIPVAGLAEPGGLLYLIYEAGLTTGVFPLLANPRTLLLGAAAQFGIFAALLGALALNYLGLDFSLADAASIGIIGGADGPTSIYVTSRLSPELLGAVAVAAYSYMALVPLIQPPVIRLLTTEKQRQIKMEQLRPVGRPEKILFPMLVLVALLLPDAAPLLGMFCFGNLMKESGVVSRLVDTTTNALINTVTILLGLAVGAKLGAEQFLVPETLGILVLGLAAFVIGTGTGVLMAHIMNRFSKIPINPIIGAAGVSAVPMAARVANRVGLDANPQNHLLMHAMGPNVAGVIGSAVAAGVLLNLAG